MHDDQIKIIKWLSSIDLEDGQRIQKPMSTFLKEFERVKKAFASDFCRIAPCRTHVYSRGLCARHYQQLRRVAAVVGWSPLAELGLCETSTLRDLVAKDAAALKKAKLQVPKRNLSDAERKLLGMKPRRSSTGSQR